MPSVNPWINLGHLLTMVQGGTNPYLFATRKSLHAFVYRAPRSALFPPYPGRFYVERYRAAGSDAAHPPKQVQLAWLAQLGARYEDIFLLAPPEDAQTFVARGFAVDFQRGHVLVAHFEGCALTIALEPGALLPTRVIAEHGFGPVRQPADRRGSLPDRPVPREITFPRASCGDAWYRVTFEVGGEPARFCEGAGADGLVPVTLAGATRVTCRAR
jgi:hypothetical protein